jgi:ankyrin repeat protein
LAVVERIIAASELRDLWEDSGSLASWLTQTERVAARLRLGAETELPERKPKAPATPRVLCKLVALEDAATNPSLRQKIRARIEALTDVNERCRETGYDTPLGMLASTPLVEEAQLLIARGADVNFSWGMGTPLTIACAAGQVEMAQALLDAGAQLFKERLIDAQIAQPMEILVDPASARPTVFRYAPALYAAAGSGTPATIDLLLARGADLRQLDLQGETLLHKAAQGGNASTLQHLISLGLDVNQTNPRSNESPLHYAVKRGPLEVVNLLLESGAAPNLVETYFDQSALDRAGDESSPMFQLIRGFGGLRAVEIDARYGDE